MNVLELSLDEFNGVVVLQLTHEEDHKVKHLFKLNSLDFILIGFFLKSGDNRWEP
jgi:hypothetical protein